jgi:hypothetical protein
MLDWVGHCILTLSVTASNRVSDRRFHNQILKRLGVEF